MIKRKEAQVGLRMDPELKARAEKQAEAEHRTLSQVVRMLIESWLKKNKRSERAA